MADEVQYTSGADSASNKRKFDDGSPPPPPSTGGRRITGFSAPIVSQSLDSCNAPNSYSNAASHGDEIELAKQRAQEIAARLFNNAESKRSRVESVGGGGYGSADAASYNLGPTGLSQKSTFSMTPSVPTSYGYSGASKKIEIPNSRVGVIIGKAGETIKLLQLQSGAKIQITRDMEADPNSPTRSVELIGTSEQVARAEELINDVLAEAESGGSGLGSRRITGQAGGAEQFIMKVPNNKVGLVIGKGGDTIKNMQATSGARIQVIPLRLPPGDTSTERTVQIDGSSEQIEAAKQLVNEVISENRPRNPGMAGGYQQGYQARPQTSWAPPVQQSGYGYVQPGAYPGPSPQYPQQPYHSSYPQHPTSGAYNTSCDPSDPQTQTGVYSNSYYNQQALQQHQIPQDPKDSNTPYAGYNQGNYGGYPASAPQPGGYEYDNSTSGYNTSNQTPSGQTPPPHNTSSSQQSSTNPNANHSPIYPAPQPQATTQPGYVGPPTSQTYYGTQPSSVYGPGDGATQAQKSQPQPAYGQPQQSPSSQVGYGYPYSQPPSAQSGYFQPPSSYGTVPAGPGYGSGQYGGQPTPYTSYGSGYSQAPPAYSGEGNANGTYDSAPALSHTTQPAAVAKSSPQG